MPDNPLRPYCPLCDKDYALDAFASHVEFPKHIMAAAWGLRATVEHLTEIRKLLQQLVDKGQQVTPYPPLSPLRRCLVCGWDLRETDDLRDHIDTPPHQRALAALVAKR